MQFQPDSRIYVRHTLGIFCVMHQLGDIVIYTDAFGTKACSHIQDCHYVSGPSLNQINHFSMQPLVAGAKH